MSFVKNVALTTAAVAIASVTGVASAAVAAPYDGSKPGPSRVASTPMSVLGYDESVAAANGFRIVTHGDGSWESVAVTETAKRLNVKTGIMRPATTAPDGAAAKGTVYGNCGSSWVNAYDSGRHVPLGTGYTVKAPVANRVAWSIYITSWAYGGSSVSWESAPSPATWAGYGGALYPGPSDGYAMAAGSVVLITGAVCASGNPTDAF